MIASTTAPYSCRDSYLHELLQRIDDRSARIGIVGLGYVGLPLAVEFAREFAVTGFDVNPKTIDVLAHGRSHILDVPSARVAREIDSGTLTVTTSAAELASCDAVIICVPTPLEKSKDPDLSYVESAAATVASHLRPGQLVVLESTTYPGTTDEVLLPMFSAMGLELDRDFYLAFSPERVDPGNRDFELREIPKVVGGCSEDSTIVAERLYGAIMKRVHPVSSARAAETAKLLENTFRLVNIAFVNEFAMLCDHLGIDVNEVIEAAATKPFGFMPFYPGPGVGGHCIPLDPLYLSWKAEQQGFISRFITLADEINSAMPGRVVELAADALNRQGKPMKDARVLILGVAYKENVDDTRRTPAIPIIDRLRARGADVCYHDPLVSHLEIDLDEWPEWRRVEHRNGVDRRRPVSLPKAHGRRRADPLSSVPLTDERVRGSDCVIILTKHEDVDYARIASLAPLVIDTRNAISKTTLSKGSVVRL
jgi:UDP-N-acetyl-D-glucosamine dehydrogenase